MSYQTKFYEENIRCNGCDWNAMEKICLEADKEIAESKDRLAASRKTTHAYIERQDKVIDVQDKEIAELKETITELLKKSRPLTGRE